MFDQQMVAMTVERMPAEAIQEAERRAHAHGISVGDVVLEALLEDVQGQLYSLRRKGKPELTVVEGGRA